jgi:BMFP domain-containing protein YqiC
MQDDAIEYRREWMESTASLSDENLRESARQRNERIRERYDEIQEMAIETRSAYEPFIQRMRELESYLANDLTPAAVREADGTVEDAKDDAQRLIQRLDGVIREIEDLALEMNTRVEER